MQEYTIAASYGATPQPRPCHHDMHAHDTCEILLFIDGDASYAVEGAVYRLHPGDIMMMRPSEAHHLIIHAPVPYERFVVNFDLEILRQYDTEGEFYGMFFDRPLGQFNHFRCALFPENHWRYYFTRMHQTPNKSRQLCYLLPLLAELAEQYQTVKRTTAELVLDKSAEIILYINRHLFEDITLETICNRFYLSKSQLNRIFKRVTGSTVWQYITIKRLHSARERLKNGDSPTKVYEKCGFRDYISFYKAYRGHYGVPPKADRSKHAHNA